MPTGRERDRFRRARRGSPVDQAAAAVNLQGALRRRRERPRSRLFRRHVEPTLVVVDLVRGAYRAGVRHAAERPVVVALRFVSGVPRKILASHRVTSARRTRRTHLQVLHAEVSVCRGAVRVVPDGLGMSKRACVVDAEMAERMPAGGQFPGARRNIGCRRRRQHQLVIHVKEHTVVADALEVPCARLLHIELAVRERRAVIAISERTAALRVLGEEETLVVRDRAERGAACDAVERIGVAARRSRKAAARTGGEHRTAVRRNIHRDGRPRADKDAAENRCGALERGGHALVNDPAAADHALHFARSRKRPRARQDHVTFARKRRRERGLVPADVKRERLVVRIAGDRRCGQRVVAEEDGDVPFHAEIVRCAERAAREHDIRLAVRNRGAVVN